VLSRGGHGPAPSVEIPNTTVSPGSAEGPTKFDSSGSRHLPRVENRRGTVAPVKISGRRQTTVGARSRGRNRPKAECGPRGRDRPTASGAPAREDAFASEARGHQVTTCRFRVRHGERTEEPVAPITADSSAEPRPPPIPPPNLCLRTYPMGSRPSRSQGLRGCDRSPARSQAAF